MTAPVPQLARWLLAALPLIGIVELVAHLSLSRSAPRIEAYAALAGPVADFKREGEPVVVAPAWAGPLVRSALDDALLPLAEQAPADLRRFASALEVGFAGQHSDGMGDWTIEETRRVGAFELRRLVNPTPPPPGVDFVAALDASVQVFVRPRVTLPGRAPTSDRRPCHWSTRARVLSGGLGGHPTFPSSRFVCPGGNYHSVGVTVIADQDYRPRRCLWAHPPASGELVIRYPARKLGQRIVGHTGIEWMMERAGSGAPVELRVRVADRELGHVVHVDGDGWGAFEVPLGEFAGTNAAVEFSVSSPDHRHRHFCFEAVAQ